LTGIVEERLEGSSHASGGFGGSILDFGLAMILKAVSHGGAGLYCVPE